MEESSALGVLAQRMTVAEAEKIFVAKGIGRLGTGIAVWTPEVFSASSRSQIGRFRS